MPENYNDRLKWQLSRPFDPLSEKLDMVWAGGQSSYADDSRFSNYYDYYFSGEDVKIFIDGLFDPKYELDIASFAYSIRQEKQPLYGFWSYNYDAMLYGTRMITGEFSIYSRYPRRMTDLLEEAAKIRANSPIPKKESGGVVSTLRPGKFVETDKSGKTQFKTDDDEKNIQKYWSYSQLDRVTVDPFQDPVAQQAIDSNHNIFSAHPPFNFVIIYGAQEVSLSPKNYSSSSNSRKIDNLDRMLMSDTNERLVKSDANKASPMKIIVQEVNIVSMATMFTSGGEPLLENYQFIARDYYMTEADLSFIKNNKTTVTSQSEGSVAQSSSEGYGNNVM